MNRAIINKIEQKHLRKHPAFYVGDTVEVNTIIREGDRQRNQKFRGLVLAIKGSGTGKMFTVRKISYGIGVEKKFPLHSPNIAEISVLKTGKTRRSKIYYMRGRVGRLALKVKPGQPVLVVENSDSELSMEAAETTAPVENTETVETVAETSTEAQASE